MIIKIIFTWRNDLLGRLARKFGMIWSHVGILYGSSLNWNVFEASMWRIRHLSLDEFINRWDQYKSLKLTTPLTPDARKMLVAYAWGNVGKPYGFGLLFRIMWDFLKNKFFMRTMTYPSHVCSSFTDECFHFVGIDLVPEKERLILPDDIFMSQKLGPDRLE